MKSPFRPLDEKNLDFFHVKNLFTTGMGVFTDGYDLSSVGIVLALALNSFGVKSLTGLQSQLLAGSALIGATLGAIIFGVLSNKGRKTYYGIDVTLMTIGAILQAFVTNIDQLILARFFLGIGIGADYVLSPMIMGEHSNAKDRGKVMALGFGLFWGFGATTAAALYLALTPFLTPDLIWRVVLAAGAVPAALVIYLRRKIPETARFLGRIKGSKEETEEVIREITRENVSMTQDLRDNVSFSRYFSMNFSKILAACLLWFLFDIVVYSGILFGPTLIARKLSLTPYDFQFLIEGLFTIPGGVVALLTLDRVGRKPMQSLGFVGMAVALTSFGFYEAQAGKAFNPALGLLLYGMYNFMSQAGPGSVSASGVLGVELAPTKIRGMVQALTVASGRIGAALTAFVFPSIFAAYGSTFAVYFLGGVAAVSAIVTMIGVPETKGKPLEESSGETQVLTAS